MRYTPKAIPKKKSIASNTSKTTTKPSVPLEMDEGIFLANWLRSSAYIFSHIVNEGWLPYAVIGRVAKKWALQGKSAGVPDYMIILKRGSLLFLELKRRRPKLKNGTLWVSPSKIQPEQIRWIWDLGKVDNIEAEFAYGWADAVNIIQRLEKA